MKKLPKFIRILIWSAVSLVGLVVLAYVIENRRGARAWAEVRQKMESHQIAMTIAELAHEPVADGENFWMTPLLAGIESQGPEHENKRERLKAMTLLSDDDPRGRASLERRFAPSPQLRRFSDFAPWAEHLGVAEGQGARAVLDELESKFGAELDELVAAADRPDSQVPSRWNELNSFLEMANQQFPHYTVAISLSRVLQLRALAALQAGEAQLALDSFRALSRLEEAAARDPNLLAHMVAVTHRSIGQSVVWEGLAREAWNREQLLTLREELGRVDLVENLARVGEGELCFQIAAVDYIRQAGAGGLAAQVLENAPSFGASATVGVIPAGWLDQNKAFCARVMLERVILPARERDWARLAAGMEAELPKSPLHPYKFMGQLILPAVDSVAKRTAYAHVMDEIAIVACGLELHRLEHGEYPDQPDLVPDLDGQQARYAKTDDGRYRLYSVGWNLRDDGGEQAFKNEETGKLNFEEGDWVWGY